MDPELGIFITEDPIKSGTNWFTYVGNNPLVYTDPTGLEKHRKKIDVISISPTRTMINVYDIGDNLAPNFNAGQSQSASNYRLQQARRNQLSSAQNKAMSADIFQRGAGGWYPPAANARETYCSSGFYGIMNALNQDLTPYAKVPGNTNANGINVNMDKSNDTIALLGQLLQEGELMSVTGEQAYGLSNAGYLVAATWENPSGKSGHIATVAPSEEEYDPTKGPLVANVGFTNGVKTVDAAFGVSSPRSETPESMDDIEYYFDPKQFNTPIPDYDEDRVTGVIR